MKCVENCEVKKCEISKCHNFLISYPIFIIFAPICREIFMLSFEIMVILDRTSPLGLIIKISKFSFSDVSNFSKEKKKILARN